MDVPKDAPEAASEPVSSVPASEPAPQSETPAVTVENQPPAGAVPVIQSGAQQQQSDSTETPSQPPVPAADTKNKPAAPKQIDDAPQASMPAAVRVEAASVPAAAESTIPARLEIAQPETASAPKTPYNDTAAALRVSEPDFPSAAPLRTGAAQEITIRIAQTDVSPVDVRITERAGQVHVDVRTADAGMQTSLRQDLGTLTTSLQKAGYHAETFTPTASLGRTGMSGQTANQDDRRDQSQNRGGSGGSSSGRRQQPQKHPGTWLEELEKQP